MPLMSCIGYIIPKPCWTRSAFFYLTCVINVKSLWRPGTHYLFSQIYHCMKIWAKAWRRRKTRRKKHRKAKQKLQQRDVELVGVENNFSFCISVFLCSQPIRSVANLTACVWNMASLVTPSSPSSHCSLIFHKTLASLEEGIFCFWKELTRPFF